jgi:enoyl-CoA hydratase/carnithine racemase
MTGSAAVLYESDRGLAIVTLNRPERLNAYDLEMQSLLIDALARADEDDDIRAVIVTGAGRAFCAGADLSGGGEIFRTDGDTWRDGGGQIALRIFASKKPVIAAINGAAVGVGLTMTLAMDFRLASEDARFGFVFTRRGLVPEACSSWFLPRLVGISKALDWVLSGRVFGAAEALSANLVREIVARDRLMPRAVELAREICESTSPVSVAMSRQMLWRMLGAAHPMEAHRIDSRGISQLGRSADAIEGVTSFLDKRPADFQMKPSTDMPPVYPWWQEPDFY